MRGKPLRIQLRSSQARIIPAHAGQTAEGRRQRQRTPDHPRACGANPTACAALSLHCGSSPRMRGKHVPQGLLQPGERIIPAHAGQTPSPWVSMISCADHPRACGANSQSWWYWYRQRGSSPRMRGKPALEERSPVSGRIIPAHAGQTPLHDTYDNVFPDHPRACGANSIVSSLGISQAGSSPRMRGKRAGRHDQCGDGRIIPAHAGQTVRFYAKTLERWTLNNWIRTVAPIFVLLFLPPVIGQNAYIERHYSNQSFSWFSKLHYASAFDLSLVA